MQYLMITNSNYMDGVTPINNWVHNAFTLTDAGCDDKISYAMSVVTPTGVANTLFSYNSATRKITLTQSADYAFLGYHTITISALGEDGRVLTDSTGNAGTGTGSGSVLMIHSDCR